MISPRPSSSSLERTLVDGGPDAGWTDRRGGPGENRLRACLIAPRGEADLVSRGSATRGPQRRVLIRLTTTEHLPRSAGDSFHNRMRPGSSRHNLRWNTNRPGSFNEYFRSGRRPIRAATDRRRSPTRRKRKFSTAPAHLGPLTEEIALPTLRNSSREPPFDRLDRVGEALCRMRSASLASFLPPHWLPSRAAGQSRQRGRYQSGRPWRSGPSSSPVRGSNDQASILAPTSGSTLSRS